MAESTKHQDKVGSFDNFRAPWETEAGQDAEIDKAKLKRLIFNLKAGEAKALDAAASAKAALEVAEKERDEAKEDAEKASPEEANKKIDRLQKKVDELTSERDKLVADKERADLRAEVLEGLEPKYAKYVTGETREELEKSLEQVREDFGLSGEGDDDPADDDDSKIRTRPRRLSNPADRQSGKPGDEEIDFDKVADDIVGSGPFR